MSTVNYSHLRLLAVFATVVETGSFAAAARNIGSSRSRVSEQVSQLENVLGIRLLQRSTRQLLVTREGAEIYDKARRLPDILGEVENTVTASEPAGRVALSMNHDFAHKFLLPLLPEFQSRYPKITLDLAIDDEVRDMIAQQIDLSIRIGLPNDSALVGRVLHEESLCVFASPLYEKKFGLPKTVKDAEKHRWIILPQISSQSVLLRSKRGRKGIEISPRDFYRCNSPLLMQKMILNGLGIGALLPSMVREEIKRHKLKEVLPSYNSEPLIFSLVYPSRKQVPQRTRVLIDFLLEKAKTVYV